MNTPREYKPNAQYFQNIANYITRNCGHPPEGIERIDINCGNGGPRGWAILKTGEKVAV